MAEYKSRRSFFKTAAAGGAFFAATPKAHSKRRQYKRKSPASVEMIEVGVITCGEYTHIAFSWALYMNPPLEEYNGGFWPRNTGMVMTYVWDPDPEIAKAFAKQYGLKVAKNYYDMVDKVDAVILSGFYATGWFPKLSKPYLEAGLPTLINRPFAFSLRETKEMIERSKKYNAPIYVPSAYETRYEAERLHNKLQKLLDDGAHVTAAHAFQVGNEYPAHGVHGIYHLFTVLEPKVVAVSLQANSWWDFTTGFLTMKCQPEDKPGYYAGLHIASSQGILGGAEVYTSKGMIQENIEHIGDLYDQLKNHNYPNMFEFNKMIDSEKMPQTHEFIMEKTTAFLTGFYSHCEKNGNMVDCTDLPEDWRAPELKPDHISEEVFK